MNVDGINLRGMGRLPGIVHQTATTWVAAVADALPGQPPRPPAPVATATLDELFTFATSKKHASPYTE